MTDRPSLGLEWLGALLDEPAEKVRWLVDQRLVVGGFSLMSGKPKAGKSTLVRCLALAVARGEPWLGWATQQGTVIYLALEEKRDEVRRHFHTMGATPDEPILVLIGPSPQDGLTQLRQAITEHRPALVIIDPLIRFVRVKDVNDYVEMTRALDPLLRLARDTDAHVTGVHHLRKGRGTEADDSLGSVSIVGIADTAFLLRRVDGGRGRTLSTVQRYGPELEPTMVTLDEASGMVLPGQLQRDAAEAGITEAIVGFLREQGDAVNESAVMDGVRGATPTKERVLRKLVSTGVVVRTGHGVKGDPYLYRVALVTEEGEKGRKEGSEQRDKRGAREASPGGEELAPGARASDSPFGPSPLQPPEEGEDAFTDAEAEALAAMQRRKRARREATEDAPSKPMTAGELTDAPASTNGASAEGGVANVLWVIAHAQPWMTDSRS